MVELLVLRERSAHANPADPLQHGASSAALGLCRVKIGPSAARTAVFVIHRRHSAAYDRL